MTQVEALTHELIAAVQRVKDARDDLREAQGALDAAEFAVKNRQHDCDLIAGRLKAIMGRPTK